MNLSVVMITYNEEDNLERTLKAVHDLADEIVIVDSFSTDRTKEIALSFNKVKFFEQTFKGYGAQKQYAVNQSNGSWILSIDADEEISLELSDHIRSLVKNGTAKFDVYYIRLVAIINGKPVRFGGWSQHFKKLLFKKDSGFFNDIKVHETWQTHKTVGFIKQPIFHYLYKNIHHHLEKLNDYTSKQAQVNFENGKKISVFKIIFAPVFYFFKMYFLKLGFLDGATGLYLAIFNFFYAFTKYYKQYNLQKFGQT